MLSVCAGLSACLPWRTTTQPALKIQARTVGGSAIPDAQVHFVKMRVGLLTKVEPIELRTDSSGYLQLDKQSEWYLAFFAPDGMYSYEWFMCIEKDGYHSVVKNKLLRTKLPTPFTVTLNSAQANQPCVWNNSYPFGFKIDIKHES